MTNTINVTGTGGIIEGNLGSANVNVNLDSALYLDGTGDHITAPSDSSLDFGSGVDFSFSMWVKFPSTLASEELHLISRGQAGNATAFTLRHNQTNLFFKFSSGSNSGNYALAPILGTWAHIAMTFDRSANAVLYVNGVAQITQDISSKTGNAISLAQWLIGGENSASPANLWKGHIADVKIFADLLSETEVKQLASKINVDSAIFGIDNRRLWYKINEGTGTSIVDHDDSGTDYNGTLSNGNWEFDTYSVDVYDNSTTTDGSFTITQGKVEGKALTSLHFHSDNDHVTVGTDSSLSLTNNMTFAAWIKPDTVSGEQHIISRGVTDNASSQYTFGLNSQQIRLKKENVGNFDNGTNVVVADVWNHVAVTVSSTGGLTFYHNGVNVGTDSNTTNCNSSSGAFFIGQRWDATNNFNGQIKEVKVFDYVKSEDGVASLYSNTYPQTPKHYWKLDDSIQGTATTTAVDSGTGTTANGTLTNFGATDGTYAGSGWNNGTLDLDGQLVVAANGTLSMPRGDLQMSIISSGLTSVEINCTDVTTQFIHNNGQFVCDSSSAFELDANGAAFYKVKANTSGGNLRLIDNTIIEKELVSGTGASVLIGGNKTFTFGTATQSADINHVLRASLSGGVPTVTGASTLFPVNINVYDDMARDYDLKLANVNVTTALVHNRDTTITLTGDCEFDAVTVSSGDTLDLNGQRAECSGNLRIESGGAMKSTGGGLIVGAADVKILGSAEGIHDGDVNMIVSGGTHDWRNGAADGAAPWCRKVLVNGNVTHQDQLGGSSGNSNYNPESVIVGNGKLTQSGGHAYLKDLTIATGGDLEMTQSTQKTIDLYGDFTTSGGLLNESALETVASSSEYAATSSTYDLLDNRSNGTIEFWLKITDISNTAARILNVNSSGSGEAFYVRTDGSAPNTSLQFHLGCATTDATFSNSDTSLLLLTNLGTKWHHYALVKAEDVVSLYIDGKKVAQKATSGNIQAANSALVLGKYHGASSNFADMVMDELRFYTDARTQTEIRDNMFTDSPTGNLVGHYKFDEGSTTTSADSSTNSNALTLSGTGAWAGSGTFTISTSTLVMSGTSKKIIFTGNENVGNLQISGTTTLEEINGNDGYLQFNGTLTVDASKTLSSTSGERLIFNSSSDTIVINNAATGLSGLYSLEAFHTSGTVSLPACTTSRLKCYDGGTTQATGDITTTEELEVNSGTTFNANGNTIASRIVDINSGTLDLRNSTLNFSVSSSSDQLNMNSDSIMLSGNTAINGHSSATKTLCVTHSQAGIEVVGDVKHMVLDTDSDLTVIGSVIGCDVSASGANIRQFFHTLDTQQLLDADEAGDDDLRLEKPALDNANELQTG